MTTYHTYHLALQNWKKAYRQAAIAFGFLLGLNTVVLLGIGMMQLDNPSPMFGPPVMLLGMGAALGGITIGLTGSIAKRQRWAAIVGLVLTILLAFAALANFAMSVGDSSGGSGGAPAPTCGIILFFIIGLSLVRAIKLPKPVEPPPPPPPQPRAQNPYAPQQPGGVQAQQPAPSYTPYGQSQQAVEKAKVDALGTGGLVVLALGAVLLVGGIGTAIYGFVSETTVSEAQWRTVRDEELGVMMEMPGEPVVTDNSDSGEGSYEKLYTVERHQYIVELTCTRLAPEWYFEEADFVHALETQFEKQYVRSQSTSRVTINGRQMTRVDYQLHDGGSGVILGYYEGREAVMVSVVETDAVDNAVSTRALQSLQRLAR